MGHGLPIYGTRTLLVASSGVLVGLFGVTVFAHGALLQSRDVVVTPQNWITGLTLTTGATFRVPRPVEHDQWTLAYSPDVLRLLTPKNRAAHPGPDGWRFETRTRGTTEITFNGVVHTPPGTQPNPPRFTLEVRVR